MVPITEWCIEVRCIDPTNERYDGSSACILLADGPEFMIRLFPSREEAVVYANQWVAENPGFIYKLLSYTRDTQTGYAYYEVDDEPA